MTCHIFLAWFRLNLGVFTFDLLVEALLPISSASLTMDGQMHVDPFYDTECRSRFCILGKLGAVLASGKPHNGASVLASGTPHNGASAQDMANCHMAYREAHSP